MLITCNACSKSDKVITYWANRNTDLLVWHFSFNRCPIFWVEKCLSTHQEVEWVNYRWNGFSAQSQLDSGQTTLAPARPLRRSQKFENRGLTLRTHRMLSVHTTPEEYTKNETITGHSGFVFEEIRKVKSRDYRDVIVTSFSKCFLPTRKCKAGVFKFLRFEERFWKPPFSWRKISVEGSPNGRDKATFSNFSDVVWRRLSIQL